MEKTIRVFFTCLFLIYIKSYAQCTLHLSGKVTDIYTGSSIENVTIQIISSEGEK